MRADFSGYATRNGIKCSDGLTIMPGAFKHNDGKKVPLVWQHMHDDPINVLGHAVLENRDDGVYAYAYFNDTDQAQHAKSLVTHKDITALSIYANRLKKQGQNVQHGEIRELSLVMAGANEGAYIDFISIQHGDDFETSETEFIFYPGLELEHSDPADSQEEAEIPVDETVDEAASHADDTEGENMAKDQSVQEVFETLNEEQEEMVNFLVGEALATAAHSDEDGEDFSDSEDNDNIQHGQKGNTNVTRNLFETEQARKSAAKGSDNALSHSEMKELLLGAPQMGSVKKAVEAYALQHGIEDIETLFPDAQAVTQTPEFLKRRTAWVARVMDGTHHTPFARIKSTMADLTPDEARAKGYIKGNLKQEEFFKVSKRVTTPQTVYKKQKLERDDVVDITDFDVVAWLKGEMRLMLEEEIARAILIGDGRSLGDIDKIDPEHIRPIATDDELYATTIYVNIDAEGTSADSIIDAIAMQRHHYRGSGSPEFFTSETILAKLLTAKDTLGRRLYKDMAEVASALRVTAIIPVEVFEAEPSLIGIMVDLRDYNVGTNRGGDVTLFDDFDIDYNQLKYLIETRLSGALVKPKSALVVRKTAPGAALVTPTAPTRVDGDTVTVPTQTGVTWSAQQEDGTVVAIASGTITLTTGNSPVTVKASPASSSFYFATDANDEWTYAYEA